MMVNKISLTVLLFMLIGSAHSYQFSLYSTANFSDLNGFIQIPAGGIPGTSSPKRPTFDELGIFYATFPQYGFTVDTNWLGFYAEYQPILINSKNVLTLELRSHNILIPPHTTIIAKNRLKLYRVGINHKFYFLTNKLEINPEVELAFLNLFYKFYLSDQTSERGFHAATMRLGLIAAYFLNPDFSLSAHVASSLRSVGNLEVQTANVNANLNILKIKQVQTTLFAGTEYERINFKDHQRQPNHINLKFMTTIQIGIRVKIC